MCNKTDVSQLNRTDLVATTEQAAAITGLPLMEDAARKAGYKSAAKVSF